MSSRSWKNLGVPHYQGWHFFARWELKCRHIKHTGSCTSYHSLYTFRGRGVTLTEELHVFPQQTIPAFKTLILDGSFGSNWSMPQLINWESWQMFSDMLRKLFPLKSKCYCEHKQPRSSGIADRLQSLRFNFPQRAYWWKQATTEEQTPLIRLLIP